MVRWLPTAGVRRAPRALLIAGLVTAAVGVGCSHREPLGSEVADSAAYGESLVVAIKTFLGVEVSSEGSDLGSAVVEAGASQGAKLLSASWTESQPQLEGGAVLPALLVHETGPPAILLDTFAFEGEQYYLLASLQIEPLVLDRSGFTSAGWSRAIWRANRDRESANTVAIGAAKVSVNGLWRSLGAIKPFGAAQTEFRLTNVSDVPLRIERVGTSCGCTTVGDLTSRTIRAGESVVLPVTVKTDSRPLIKQTVWVMVAAGDDPTPHDLTLTMFGWQPESLEVVPTWVDFGPVYRSEPARATIRLTEAATDRCQVESVDVSGLPLAFEIERGGRDGLASYLVRLRLEPSMGPAGEQSGLIRIRNTSRRRPIVELRVHWSVLPEVKPRPPILDFSPVMSKSPISEILLSLEHRKSQPLQVSVLDVPDGYRVDVRESGPHPRLAVSVPSGLAESKTGVLRLSARWQGGEETVEVPCYRFASPIP